MTTHQTVARRALGEALAAVPVVAIVRLPDARAAAPAVRAVRRGGVRVVEVTLTTAGALEAVRALTEEVDAAVPDEDGVEGGWSLAGTVVGIGSVRVPEAAVRAIEAGARFLVTPTFHPGVLAVAAEAGIPVICGVLTPTELDAAAREGADYLKLFPASSVGPNYLREVLAPMPDLRVIPTGGIQARDVTAWVAAGAFAVAAGSALVAPDLVHAEQWDQITRRAGDFVSAGRLGLHTAAGRTPTAPSAVPITSASIADTSSRTEHS